MTLLRSVALSLFASVLAACGAAAGTSSSPTPTSTSSAPASASATATPTAPSAKAAGGITFTVSSGSKAVVRVTEQLADRQSLSDAVLTSEKVTGSFTLLADGTFSSDSKIAVDLNALASDQSNRDRFIKQNTLQTSRFPTATFVPVKATGLALPLPATGELSFTLAGKLTVHGVTKDAAFDVKATRSATGLTATANAMPALTFGDFGMEQPRVFVVVSIKDEIRLEVDLVATQP